MAAKAPRCDKNAFGPIPVDLYEEVSKEMGRNM